MMKEIRMKQKMGRRHKLKLRICISAGAFLILLTLLVLYLVPGAAALEVLKLNVDRSYVRNLDTGVEHNYTEVLGSNQLEGERLEFHIYVSKTGSPILENYVLELYTDMSDPEWKFGDNISHSGNWIVWEGKEAHEGIFPSPIILSAEVPKPLKKVKEPGFEAYDLDGLSKKEVEVRLSVGRMEGGNITYIQKLSPVMRFYATNKKILAANRSIEANLTIAESDIGKTGLEEDIRRLYEEGHPGWAMLLSRHYRELSAEMAPPPLALYLILAVVLGLILGAASVYVYATRGGGRGVDIEAATSALEDVSGQIDANSSSISRIAGRFARSEDEDKRGAARELLKIRAALTEISNDIRAIADRLRVR